MSQLLTLPARSGTAMRLASGAVLKIVNTHGTQVVDCWAFNSGDLGETMSMPHSRNNFWHLSPSPGDCFVTNLRRPILTLVEDTSPGIHDTLIPCCDRARYESQGHPGHDNCADNMASGLRGIGIATLPLLELLTETSRTAPSPTPRTAPRP